MGEKRPPFFVAFLLLLILAVQHQEETNEPVDCRFVSRPFPTSRPPFSSSFFLVCSCASTGRTGLAIQFLHVVWATYGRSTHEQGAAVRFVRFASGRRLLGINRPSIEIWRRQCFACRRFVYVCITKAAFFPQSVSFSLRRSLGRY